MMKIISEHITSILLTILLTLCLVFGAGTWINHRGLQKARGELIEAGVRADNLEREIKDVRASQELFKKQLKTFNTKQAQLTQKQHQMVKELKNVSTESKAYLDTPIPDDVRRVLDSAID